MEYVIDYNSLKEKIKKSGAVNVLVQLPDGLKPYYDDFVENLRGEFNIFFWAGSCFGSCDLPLFVKDAGIDLIVHVGHKEWC